MFSISDNGTMVIKDLKSHSKAVEAARIKTLDSTANTGERMERKLVRKRTHALENSITVSRPNNDTRWIGSSMKWYGICIEHGRKGFSAKGVSSGLKKGAFMAGSGSSPIGLAQALRFKVGGKYIFRKSVGPSKPYPFVKPTYEYLKVYYPKLMKQNIHKALN